MKPHVILVNPMYADIGFRSYRKLVNHYAMRHMELTLKANGIETTTLPRSGPEMDSYKGHIKYQADEILSYRKPGYENILGLSHNGGVLQFPLDIASRVRKKDPNMIIIGGGPAIHREKLQKDNKAFPDVIDILLSQKIGKHPVYDGLVQGGLQALIDICQTVNEGKYSRVSRLDLQTMPNGYYATDGGAGTSQTIPLNFGLFVFSGDVIDAYLSSKCANACDYCSLGSPVHPTIDQIVNGAKQSFDADPKMAKAEAVSLMDPNALAHYNIERTVAGINKMKEIVGKNLAVGLTTEPELFKEPDNAIRYLKELNVRKVFIGRETAGEPGLSYMGRRYRGNPKTESDLRDEITGITEVLHKIREQNLDCRPRLNYILTPVETEESLRLLDKEWDELYEIANGNISLAAAPLAAYPGSRLLEEKTEFLDGPPYLKRAEKSWDMKRLSNAYPDAFVPRHQWAFRSRIRGC